MRFGLAVVLVGAAVPIADRVSIDAGLASDSSWYRVAVALFWAGVAGAPVLALGDALWVGRLRAARDLASTALVAAAISTLVLVPWVGTTGGEVRIVMVAVATGLAFGAGLLARRSLRRAVGWLAIIGITAGVIAGVVLIDDVVVAALIGWGAAALVRLVFGCPQAVPTNDDVVEAGAAFEIDLRDVRLQPEQQWGLEAFTAANPEGDPVDIAVYRRDAGDAQFFSRLWHSLWFKDAAPSVTLTRLQQVEHEAFVLLMANRAQVGVPNVLAAGIVPSSNDAVLLTSCEPGRVLADVPADELDLAALTEVWRHVRRLHDAGIAHSHLTTRKVVIDTDRTITLRGLHDADTAATAGRLSTDVAELLTGLALQVGSAVAVESAVAGLGTKQLADVLPLLQPAALLPATRRALKAQPKLLDELRDAGAAAAGIDAPELAKLRRITFSDVAMLAASGFGIYLVADQLGSLVGMGPAIAEANFFYLFIAMVLGALTAVTMALAMTGAIAIPLPFGPVVGVQLANQFTGLVGGTVAITATNIRFIQKRGLNAALAVSAGVTTSLAGFAFQIIIIVVAFIAMSPDIDLGVNEGSHTTALVVLVVVMLVLGVVLGIPRFRKSVLDRVRAPAHAVAENMRELFHHPGHLPRVAVGVVGTQLFLAVALWLSLEAYGTTVPLLTLLLLNVIAALVGGVAPVPGGLGVMEGVLIEGLKRVGVDTATATVAVLSYRLVTAYLPPIWGWASMAWLGRHDYL